MFPSLLEGSIALRSYTAGLTSYTPDGGFLVGSLPALPPSGCGGCGGGAVRGTSVISGCNGAGLSAAGGLGSLAARHALAEAGWLCDEDGDEAQDARLALEEFRLGRFGAVDVTTEAFRARCSASRGSKFQPKEAGAHA